MNIIVKIESYDHQGRGISHYNNKVMFIPNALLNEELEVKIIEENFFIMKYYFRFKQYINYIS